MGKRLFKFISDPAARTKAEPPAKRREPGAPDLTREQATWPGVGPSSASPELDPALELAAIEEAGTRYSAPTVEIAGLAAADDMAYLRMLAEQTGLRLVDLAKMPRPPDELIGLLSAEQAKRLTAVPVGEENGVVVIAVADPANPVVSDDLRVAIDREIETVIAPEAEIRERIEQYYGLGEESLEGIVRQAEVVEENPDLAPAAARSIDLSDVVATANAPPIVKLVNVLLVKAIKERASDIHIEPFPKLIRIRYRVDGLLREIPSPPRTMMLGLASRIKVMSGLDIAETRLPQDGRINLTLEGREVDLRVSTVPTVHGESIVMRVLDKSMMMMGINQVGMTDDVLERFRKHIHKPNGIMLVTGPTGCGKTTTLYAALNEIKDPGDKIITVEDPVEYKVDGIIQVNINEGVGLTFARTLRAILRQDPDKVLVGEIRDVETAQIAVQASLTGHLVFSTLHTNSASATITRLIDMGIEPFLITSSVEAVVGQRLVRTICTGCRAAYTPIEDDIREFEIDETTLKEQSFFHGRGCPDCGHTGYRGRMGLFELLEIDDEMCEMILDQGTTDEIQDMARRNGMRTMRQDGWMKACLGVTTMEEVARETARDAELAAIRPEPEPAPQPIPGAAEPKPEIPAKPVARLDDKRMMVEGEAGARIYDVSDTQESVVP